MMRWPLVIGSGLVLGLTGCSGLSQALPFWPFAQTQGVSDRGGFLGALGAMGFGVEEKGTVTQPFLAPTGNRYVLTAENLAQPAELQVYEYASAAAASEDAKDVGPGGSPDGMLIDWQGPPHFHRKERLIVLYVGSDPVVLDLLRQMLGPQFAGHAAG